MTSQQYPIVFIQCDWNDVLRLPNSEAWISVKYRTEPSVHGKITTSSLPPDGRPKCSASEEFIILNQTLNMLSVKHVKSGLVTAFVSPMKTYNVHSKGVLSVSAAENAMVVSASEDDKLVVWDSRTGEELLTLKGHGGPAYRCHFFPSGVVVLSAGADGSLRVWSAETGISPVTLQGHAMAVCDVGIVDKGRNVISASKDGKVKLWDVGESKCLGDIIEGAGTINSCCLLTTSQSQTPANPREIGTNDKLVVCGCENGSVICSHIAMRQNIFHINTDSPVNCVEAFDQNILVGCQDGKIISISSENGSVLSEWWESNSPVLCLCSLGSNKFIAGRQDGSCMVYSLEYPAIRVQLTGPDCDAVREISFNGRWVFTACRDSFIRKYDFNQLAVHFK